MLTSFYAYIYEKKNLGELREIGGNAEFRRSKITNLGKLKQILGEIQTEDTRSLNFSGLEHGLVHVDFSNFLIFLR